LVQLSLTDCRQRATIIACVKAVLQDCPTMHRTFAAEAIQHEAPIHFEDIEVGDRWRSPDRTIDVVDVQAFAQLTGDHNPLHLDEQFASQTPFGRPIAHGLLGMSLVAGLGSRSPWMDTAVFVRVLDWHFVRPLYVGDTVHVQTQVLDKRATGRRRGLVTWRRQLFNQHNEVVQEGTTETLVMLQANGGVPR
jgi:acyl dehydratase